ncbi:MAG: mechanosensitive ion channel [Bacteroidales bacterium]|nr:mechanosensitive ion channel [Bacteroidales bacterium]
MDFNVNDIWSKLLEMAVEYGPRLIGAIIILMVGIYIIRLVDRLMKRRLDKHSNDPSLTTFLKSLVNIALKVLLVISVLSMVGVEMTSFIAILGAAGLAIGMALSGMLQNFAGGVVILIFKPFKVGDYIDAQGHAGTVKEIQIFSTVLTTLDNKTIIVPNGQLATATMTNYSTQPQRRVDWSFGIAYGDDLEAAKSHIQSLCDADQRILKDPSVLIAVGELGASSVNIYVRAWVNAADYWSVFFDMNEQVYKTFAHKGLNIPFPQLDVHLHQQK